MTVLFVHGWQDLLHDLGKYDVVGSGFNAQTPLITSRHGSGQGQVPEFRPQRRDNNNRHRVLLDPSLTEVAVGTGIRTNSSADVERTIQFRVGSTWLLTLATEPGSSRFALRAGGSSQAPGTLLASADWSSGTWFHVAMKAVIDGEDSTWELYVDDVLIGSGVHDLGTDPITEVTVSGSADGSLSGANNSRIAYEDTWVTDGELLFDARVVSLRPDGVGNAAEWTPQGSGDNFEEVNALPPDADTYVSSDTDGDRDTHALPTPVSDSSRPQVRGVFVNALARRSDTEDRSLRMSLRVDGTDYDSDPMPITSPALFTDQWPENPATSSPWLPADLDGLEAGYVAVKP